MIARSWRGAVKTADAEAYAAYIDETVMQHYGSTPGNRGAWMLTRAMPGELSGVALGMPLPPSAGKKRLSIVLQTDDIASTARPPFLKEARTSAPAVWWPTLDRLGEVVEQELIPCLRRLGFEV